MVLVVSWMGYTSVKKLDTKQTITKRQSDLSAMLSQLGQANLNESTSTILIFFNSECEYCQSEIKEIGKNIDQFNQHQLLLASFEREEEAVSFLYEYGLSNHYVKSTPDKVLGAFSGGVPQTLIYHQGKLTRHFKDEVKIEAILEALEER